MAKRKQTALIILIIVVTMLVLVGLFGTLSLLHNYNNYQKTVDTKPVANRLVIMHTNVPIIVDDFQLTVLVTAIAMDGQVPTQVTIDVTDNVTRTTTNLTYNHLNQTQAVGQYQLRLSSATSSAVQVVITKL